MQIVELGDCSVVIMKDSDDSMYFSVGKIYRKAANKNSSIAVYNDRTTLLIGRSYDYIYTAGRLIVFFKDKIDSRCRIHDKVSLIIL